MVHKNELHPTIFINLQPPPADCKSLSASGEPDVLHPVYSKPSLWVPGKWKGNISDHCQGRSTRIQKPGNSTLEKESRSFPARFHLPPREVVFNCCLKSLSKLFKALSAHSGRFCWAPGAAVVSSLLSITGAEILGRVPIFHSLFNGQYPTDYWCGGDGWDLFHGKLLAIHLSFSTCPWGIFVNDILSLFLSVMSML